MTIPKQPWQFTSDSTCHAFLQSIGRHIGDPDGRIWCPGVTDEVVCWPATPAGETSFHSCPPFQGVDLTKLAKKICNSDGTWFSNKPGQGLAGYTDYDGCYTARTKTQFDNFYGNSNSTTDGPARFDVVIKSRLIEMAGFPMSLLCVLISLFIFRYFRSLRCTRTTLHVHLFSAIAIMTASKTIEITDQVASGYIHRGDMPNVWSIRTTRPLCELLTVLIEYSRTAMFMWMFLEGLYMHNVVAWKVFQSSKPNYLIYCAIGWGFPALLVAVWAPLVEFVVMKDRWVNGTAVDYCWYQHSLSDYYRIIEAPRLFFIAINVLFLANIIRVLLTKLRDSHQSDTVQIRKAVKATIVLAPLLGVTQLIWGVPDPIDHTMPFFLFASWLYISHFARSFEGMFVCIIYCFMNGEVQAVFRTAFDRRAVQRETTRSAQARRVSSPSSGHLTRYMQVNRESVLSSDRASNKRDTTNRILKLLNCWPSRGTNEVSRPGRHPTSMIPADSTTMQFQINSIIPEKRAESVEM